jgi:dolichol-phosphate mannosyltransferase
MLAVENNPVAVQRVLSIARRFQKFVLVGAIGLAVNQGLLFALVSIIGMRVVAASPLAILASMVVTFLLNEQWTWRDRGEGTVLRRASYYGLINSGGLLINWGLLIALHNAGLNYLIANFVGAGVAAVWNFSLNHQVTWKRSSRIL